MMRLASVYPELVDGQECLKGSQDTSTTLDGRRGYRKQKNYVYNDFNYCSGNTLVFGNNLSVFGQVYV